MRFYSKYSRKPWKSFNQRKDITQFTVLTDLLQQGGRHGSTIVRGLTEKGGRETEGQAGRDVGQESEAAVRGEAEGSGDRESNGE